MLTTFAKVASSYWENNPGSEERLPKAQSMMRVLTPEENGSIIECLELRLIVVVSLVCVECVYEQVPLPDRMIDESK